MTITKEFDMNQLAKKSPAAVSDPLSADGAPAVRIGEIGETSLEQHVDRLYDAEVLRALTNELPCWEAMPDEKAEIERALSSVFWSSFHATDRHPVILEHDPLDRLQPTNPFDIKTLAAHKDRARKLDRIRRQSFLIAVHSLVQQIANGEIVVVGRREPVETVDQPWEELPFGALQNQHWRLCRGFSRVQIMDERGGVTSTFREVRLRAKGERPMIEVPPASAAVIGAGVAASRSHARGGLDYREDDYELCKQMHEMIASGKAISPWDAADLLADKAKGKGSHDSKRVRLYDHYNDWVKKQSIDDSAKSLTE
jgi:hypothetical protein